MDTLNQAIAAFISPILGKKTEDILAALEIPTHQNQGDRSIPCFRWSKEERTSPQSLAQAWVEKIKQHPFPEEIEKVEVLSGYVNFFAKTDVLARNTIAAIQLKPGKFGFVHHAKPPIAIVEFSSPNIAKPFSIGHLRSTNIGACISRIFQARGWKVIKINHLGDWGTQFGKLMSAYRRWGKAEDLDERPMAALYKLYVKFHEQEVSDPTLIDEAREWFSKLEKGDQDARELWEWFRELTMKELDKLYARLGIEFDHFWGESFYVHLLPELMNALSEKKLTQDSEDAVIIDLDDYKLHTCLIQKKDESSLYITRDLAAAIYRQKQLHFDRMIYVVGAPQQLHFQQLFKVLELMGHEWSNTCEHVMFGHIAFGDESMSTRKGNIVFLTDVLEKAMELALKVVEEKNPELENKEKVAEQIGLGAVLFADLSARRIKDVKFTWEDILSFEGETGPYLQYSLVRMRSLVEKFGQEIAKECDTSLLSAPEEATLVRTLSLFPLQLERAERDREPFIIAQYLIGLSRDFNRFYTHHRILDSEANLKMARMVLVACTASVLESGLALLGIPAPQKM